MRVNDMKHSIDQLDEIEAAAALLAGRLAHGRIVAAGHSRGGQPVGMPMGARLTDPKDAAAATDVDVMEPRIKASVLLVPPGLGDDDLRFRTGEGFRAEPRPSSSENPPRQSLSATRV